MEYLVSTAQMQPMFFKGAMDGVVAAMLQVASAASLEFSTRSMALELMVTLTETAPALARRCPGLVKGLVPLAFSLMLEVDESESEWVRGSYSEEPADENHAVGEEAIERAATGMGGKVIAPPVFEIVQQYAAHMNWNYRRAAVAAVQRLVEGCSDVFKTYLQSAMQFLHASLSDASQRVRYQAIETIGRLPVLYPNHINQFVEKYVPVLTGLLADTSMCDKVRGHAASALINIVNPEDCESDILEPFLDGMLSALVGVLQSSSLEVQGPSLLLLGLIAQNSSTAFIPHYASFMPGIKSILHTATAEQYADLRGKAMQCVGLLGEAVGVQTFAPDALEVMQLLLAAMAGKTPETSDGIFESILPACARISKALGPQFEMFLPTVMGPLLVGAAQEIKFSMVDVNDSDEDGDIEEEEDR